MADKYTIQVQPQVTASDAKKMENDLNKRFSNVAAKFGSHLQKSIKNVAKIGLVTAGAGITGALLTNPFEKINEDLNQRLENSDNTVTRAEQFGVSSGKFFQAEQIAASSGLKDLDPILARFAGTLEQARTGEDDTLKQFLEKDVIDAFFEFSESLRELKPDQRNAAVERVFGERMGLRIAEFLQTDNEKRRKEIFGNTNQNQLSAELERQAKLEELQAINRSRLAVTDLMQKGSGVNEGMVRAQNTFEQTKLAIQATQLSQYELFSRISITQEKALYEVAKIGASITEKIIPAVEKGATAAKDLFNWATTKPKNTKTIKFFAD